MTQWTHSICQNCWNGEHPEEGGDWKNPEDQEPSREPVTLIDVNVELCCICNTKTSAGIYIRRDPKHLPCKGNHKV